MTDHNFVNILERETYIDDLGADLIGTKHLEAAAMEFLSVLEVDGNDTDENEENAWMRHNIAKTLCNSIHFAAEAEKRRLEAALGELAEAERASVGTEMSEQEIDKALKKIGGLERRIAKYRQMYKVLAFQVFPANARNVLDVLPDWASQYISTKHEPWQPKEQFQKRRQQASHTASKAMAQEKLKQYKRA